MRHYSTEKEQYRLAWIPPALFACAATDRRKENHDRHRQSAPSHSASWVRCTRGMLDWIARCDGGRRHSQRQHWIGRSISALFLPGT